MPAIITPPSEATRSDPVVVPSRFRKMILRTGRWYGAGHGGWTVTREHLERIVRSFQTMTQRGIEVPFQWKHGDDPRDRIGDVIDLSITEDENGAQLWATLDCYCDNSTPRLGTINKEVSPQVREGWRDGGGEVYDLAVTHVAVVDHGAVLGQGNFERILSAGDPPMTMQWLGLGRKSVNLEADNGDDKGKGDGDGSAMDQKTLISKINVILKAVDPTGAMMLPPDTNENNFADRLSDRAQQIEARFGKQDDKQPTPEAGTVAAAAESAGDQIAADLSALPSSLPGPIKARIDALVAENNRLREIEAINLSAAESAFTGRIDQLITDRRIEPAMRDTLLTLGKPSGFNLAVLEPYNALPQSAVGTGKTRDFATGDPPAAGGSDDESPAERRARAAKEW